MKITITFVIGLVSLCSFYMTKAQQASASKIEGTPYLNEQYVEGEIFFGEANRTKVPVRYNIYQDLMEYKQNGKALVLDPSNKIKKVRMGDETFIVEKINTDGKSKYSFLHVLDTAQAFMPGKMILMSKKMIKYQEPLQGKALDGGDLPAKFSRLSDAYFYRIGDGELKEVGNLKDLIASLPDKQEEVKQFAKKEKISPKKEQELLKLVSYYNSL
jgi:hypothetical protein